MKYNENLFNISSECYKRTSKNDQEVINDDINIIESKLLKILLKRFKELLNDKTIKYDGILKTTFREVTSNKDDGIDQLEKLFNYNKFDSFANKYGFYLSDVINEEFFSHYEISWDYKTYFETLNTYNKAINDLKTTQKEFNKKNIDEAINKLLNMPLKHQLEVINSFLLKIRKEEVKVKKEEVIHQCKTLGHNYSDWEKIDYTTMEENPFLRSRDYIVPEGKEYIYVPHTKWKRTCKRCHYIQEVKNEPQELIEKRKKEEKQEKIKKLKKELERLENE